MKSDEIKMPDIAAIRKAYEEGSDETRKLLVNLYGDAVKSEDNRPITERVKTFEDACDVLGLSPQLLSEMWIEGGITEPDEVAYQKLRLITASLNEGWTPDWDDKSEKKWYPWFYICSKAEYDEMDDEEKGRFVLRSGNYSNAHSGLAYALAYYASSGSYTYFGGRLAFHTPELAKYAGEQFKEIYADFFLAS